MAAFRQLRTDFWNTQYVANLSCDTRYLFLYLKLNPHLNTAGFAKLPVELIALETGLDTQMIRNGLLQLEADNKIKYEDEYLVLCGGHDGQTTSRKVQSAIDAQLAAAPDWIGEYIMRGADRDERVDHPAIQAVRDVLEKYPPKKDWDTVIELLGEDFDEEFLVQCQAEWARRGYAPFNLNWLYDWYANRKIPGQAGRKPTNTDTLSSYNEVFSS